MEGDTAPASWARYLGLLLTGVLFVAMALRLLLEARFNPETVTVLVQSGDVAQVLLLVLVDAVPAAATMLLISATFRIGYQGFSTNRTAYLVLALLLTFLVVPWTAAYPLLLASPAFVFSGWRWRGPPSPAAVRTQTKRAVDRLGRQHVADRAQTIRQLDEDDPERAELSEALVDDVREAVNERVEASTWALAVGTGILGIVVLFVLLWNSSMWLPAEHVELGDGSHVAAFVVDPGDGWVHLVAVGDRAVRTVAADSIEGRQVCRTGTSRQGTPAVGRLLGWSTPKHPPCDEPAGDNDDR